jgi:hypothetical protein
VSVGSITRTPCPGSWITNQGPAGAQTLDRRPVSYTPSDTLSHGYSAFRICQTVTETPSHRAVAPPRAIHARSLGTNRQTTNAKTNNPMLAIAAPAASILAALLPRAEPLSPRDVFFSLSCFSMSVALAGKIAGNAKNKPPIPGPNFLAIIPATTVISPPKRNRTA